MSKLRFLAIFLLAFSILLALWTQVGIGAWHERLVLGVAALTGPAVHGWMLLDGSSAAAHPQWVRGDVRVELRIQFDALSVGLVPLWALFLATPSMTWLRRLRGLLLGTLVCTAIDAAVVVFFPVLVHHTNVWTDVGGTFIGLVGFVGAPVIVWFTLAWSEVRRWLPSLRDAPRSGVTSPLQH